MAGRFKPKRGATAVMLAVLCVLLALGTWQVKRLAWKEGLIARIDSLMAEKPVPLPEKIDDPKAWEFRRVTMAGSFLDEKQFLIKPRTHDGVAGYHVVVPFQRASGGFVFVNRGWASDELLQKIKQKKSMFRLDGVVTVPEKTPFTPENAPEKNDWYWIDVAALARAADLKNVSPVVVQVTEGRKSAVPIPVPVMHNLRNDHRYYAIFWFGMAGILLAIWVLHSRGEKKDGSV